MKKAKLILGAIAVLAAVGGVYAAKAHRASDVLYYKTTTVTSVRCTFTKPAVTLTTTFVGQAPISTYYVTPVYNALCPVAIPYYAGI